MEFGTLVWNPIYKKHIDLLESIQRRFLKFTYFKIFQYYPNEMAYDELLAGFRISTLENRSKLAMLDYLHNVLQGHGSQVILREVSLRIPRSNARLS